MATRWRWSPRWNWAPDDYVRLPCDLSEIGVRIWALLRWVGIRPPNENESPLSSGRLFINPATYEVFLSDQRITLTFTEFPLLHLLVKNRGTVVAHQTLVRVWWREHVDSSGLVKKYVRLRRKLTDDAREPSWIARKRRDDLRTATQLDCSGLARNRAAPRDICCRPIR